MQGVVMGFGAVQLAAEMIEVLFERAHLGFEQIGAVAAASREGEETEDKAEGKPA
jgi:hypothetical protein